MNQAPAADVHHTPTARGTVWKTLGFTISHFFNDSYPSLYPALLPVLMVDMKFSVALAGLLSSIVALTTQLLQPVMGLWADRVGTRYFVVGGLFAGSILTAGALAWAPSYTVFVVLLLIAGLGNAAFHPHASALVGDLTKERKGFFMSLFMIGGNLGRAMAPIMVTTAYLWWGRHGLWVLALPGVIVALLAYRLLTPPPKPRPRSSQLLTRGLFPAIWGAGALLLVVALRNLASMAALTLIPIYWRHLHRPLTESALLLTVMFLTGAVGNMSGGALSDRLGAKPVMIGSALLTSATIWWFLSSRGWTTWLAIGVLGFALYSTGSVVMVFGQALFPQNKGMASGLTLGVGNTLGALAVGLVGLVASHWSIPAAFEATAVIVLASIPFVVPLKTPERI